MKENARPRPVVLAILDGWGEHEGHEHNAIRSAHTPTWDMLQANYPHGLIDASEAHVGLPEGQMGNSEVGHMSIGSGRVPEQELPRINAAIENGTFPDNENLKEFIAKLKASGGACHLMGLLSEGGVHSHQIHLAELAKAIAAAGVPVQIHAFLDGRDTPPQSAEGYLKTFLTDIAAPSGSHWAPITMATVGGRYWGMDRDERWERIEPAYHALVSGTSVENIPPAKDGFAAIQESYAAGVTDEFLKPRALQGYAGMKDGDGMLMANFRTDRAWQLPTALLSESFEKFPRSPKIKFAAALGMVEYTAELNDYMKALFPLRKLKNTISEIISKAGLKQLHIAETEKYAHVTYFFNGGRRGELPGEKHILIPSPKVETYDLKPEMSAHEITDKLVEAIESDTYDFIVVNYANADMVGHTGNMAAAQKAIEAVDKSLGRVFEAIQKKSGVLMVTADHGNAEQMVDKKSQQPHTRHTLNKVPMLFAGAGLDKTRQVREGGTLADIAATVLAFMGLKKSPEMNASTPLISINRERVN